MLFEYFASAVPVVMSSKCGVCKLQFFLSIFNLFFVYFRFFLGFPGFIECFEQ